jgi:hypothetical protein
MSRALPATVQAVANELESTSGSYLQSTVRKSGLTCDVCGTPVAVSYTRCLHCSSHSGSGHPLADRVGSLIYAIKPDSQSYLLVYNYKTAAAGPSLESQMMALLALGLRGHTECASKLAGARSTAWAVVPSTKERSKLHDLVSRMASPDAREIKIEFSGYSRPDRFLHPELWRVDVSGDRPEHVLLVDDSWVTGSHAQGVASALKTAGVSQVSVFTVANVLDPAWGPNPGFIKDRLAPPAFDKSRCPWTGGNCP